MQPDVDLAGCDALEACAEGPGQALPGEALAHALLEAGIARLEGVRHGPG